MISDLKLSLTITGLLLDIVGACILIWPLLKLDRRELMLGGKSPMWSADNSESLKKHPDQYTLYLQVGFTRWGLGALLIGFILQLAAQLI